MKSTQAATASYAQSNSEPLTACWSVQYPLELECDLCTPVADQRLNPQAQDFRPRRDAAAAARFRMKQVADAEQCEL